MEIDTNSTKENRTPTMANKFPRIVDIKLLENRYCMRRNKPLNNRNDLIRKRKFPHDFPLKELEMLLAENKPSFVKSFKCFSAFQFNNI